MQNIRKKIDFKNQSTLKQINRVKNIQIRVCESKPSNVQKCK